MKSLKLLSISAVTALAVTSQAVLINEFQPNPAGGDPSTQTFELKGNVGDSFSGFLLSLEGDAGATTGTVDRIIQVGGTFDSNGLLTVTGDDLENPSFTLVLVDNFTGTNATDFDASDDGTVDLNLASVGITTVYDAIGVPDTSGDLLYGSQLNGADFTWVSTNTGNSSESINVFRDGVTNDWYAHNVDNTATNVLNSLDGTQLDPNSFDKDPFTLTFGDVNPTTAVPEPATMVLLGLGAAALANKKRRK